MLKGSARDGRERIEGRGGCVGSFFVGVGDDEESARREAFATSTDGQRFRIVHHVAELYCEGERDKGERRVVDKVASESVESLSGPGS